MTNAKTRNADTIVATMGLELDLVAPCRESQIALFRLVQSTSVQRAIAITGVEPARKRNGGPRILAPEAALDQQARALDPHILKAVGRAWA